MKKNITTILAFASLLGLSVCTSSCNKDDDKDNQTELQNQKEAQADATAFAANLLEYVATQQIPGATANSSELENAAQNQLGKYQTTTDENYKQLVEIFVGDATGLSKEAVKEVLSSKDISETIDGLTSEEKTALVSNASEYIDGYTDGLKLASSYKTIIDSNDEAEKEAALDELEKNIKEHYQNSEDLVYKQTYVKASAAATGLQPAIIKQILDSPTPKETALLLLGISSEGGQTAEQAATDAAKAAQILESIKGKNLSELLSDNEFIAEVGTYKELYKNGTPEYQEAFKAELAKNGVPQDVVNMFDSEEFNIMTIITALGITL